MGGERRVNQQIEFRSYMISLTQMCLYGSVSEKMKSGYIYKKL